MKFKQYIKLISDSKGFAPTPRFRWTIHQNERKTAREEAIMSEVQRQANPRENITGSFPWGPEQQMVLQQLWIHSDHEMIKWQDVPIDKAKELYSIEETEFGDMPVPNALKEPGMVQSDFGQRIKEILGDDS